MAQLRAGAYHFVILDAQYNKKGEDYSHVGWVVQGYIPQFQLDWLRDDLFAIDRRSSVSISGWMSSTTFAAAARRSTMQKR